MKQTEPRFKSLLGRICAVISALALIFGAQIASAQSIGVNFVNSDAGGVDNSRANSMLPTELAGVPGYAQTNWNNFSRYGSGTFLLNNSLGATHSLDLQWDSGFADRTGTLTSYTNTPDGKLMDGFISTWGPGAATALANSVYNSAINNKPLAYISGLQAWYTALGAEGYSVVLYTTGYSYYETGEGYIESVSGSPLTNGMVEGTSLTPHLFAQDQSVFSGTYTPATTTGGAANYMLFNALSNDAVIIRLQCSGYGAGLSAFQFIPIFPTPPTAAVPTYLPATVYAKEPVTLAETATGDLFHTNLWYQWFSDNANGGGVTNAVLSATNSTLTLTPATNASTYSIQYLVVVTNIFGASTSAPVTLAVNPSRPPVIVQDITPTIVSLYAGEGVTFKASFSGKLPIAYFWQVCTDGINYTNIPGATNTTFTVVSAGPGDVGLYQLFATNEVGTGVSSLASLDLLPGTPAYLWSAPIPFAGLTAEQILTSFPANDKIAGAMVAKNGGAPITVILTNANNQPVVFAGAGNWASLSGGTGYSSGANANQTGNAGFNTCLNDFYYDSAVFTHAITLSGLVVGQQYQVQLFALDDRSGQTPDITNRLASWQDPADATDISQPYSMADNVYVLGTFTASNVVQTIQQNLPSGTGVGNFNCLVLRTVGWNPPPYFVSEPANVAGFASGAVSLSASAAGDATIADPVIAYQWAAGPVGGPYTNLVAGAKYTGTTTTTLTISNLTAGDGIPVYVLVATNGGGYATSKEAAVSVEAAPIFPVSGSYGAAALSNNPVAFWQLNEVDNPATGFLMAYDFTGNGHIATYGAGSKNGFNSILAPQPPTYPGFAVNQGALQTVAGQLNTPVAVPPLNLNTNAVTICMWINPSAGAATYTGLFMNRNGSDTAGFGFGGNTSGGMAELGYTWNTNSSSTWGYHSGLYPLVGTWQFVALVVKSNSATIYQYYIDPNNGQTVLRSAVNSIAHTAEAFSGGGIFLGSDVNQNNNTAANNVFSGNISDVAVYNSSLTSQQILQQFSAGLGVAGFLPQISGLQDIYYTAPTPAGTTARMNASVGGTAPFTNQWQFNGVSLADGALGGATIAGAASASLSITNVSADNAGQYQLLVTNVVGMATSSVVNIRYLPATLVGQWLSGPQNMTDVSGFSPAGIHDATVQSGSTYWTNDVPASAPPGSSALYLTGAGLLVANSSTADAAYTNTFDNMTYNGMTVMCWAKGWPGGWNPWVSKYGESGQGWQMRVNNGGEDSCWTIRGTGGSEDMAASIGSNDGNWHHYAGTYSPLTGVRSLYVDGVLAATQTGQGPFNPSTDSHLMIGARDNGGNNFGNYFTGMLYDVRVYDYALPQNQVVSVKNGQSLAIPQQNYYAAVGLTSTFTTPAINAAPPYTGYQWQFNGANLADGPYLGATISGSGTVNLTVSSMTANSAGVYQLLVTNAAGATTSSIVNVIILPPTMVGNWLSGSQSLADASGFSPAGTHNAGVQSGTVGWSADVPASAPGGSYSLGFTNAGLTVSNSSSWDAAYTNTFDNMIYNGMTIMCWAKGWPAGWNPWASKWGENGQGWQLRVDGWNTACWTMRGTGGSEDMTAPNTSNDGNWHHYTGTYSPVTGVRSLYVDGVLAATQSGQKSYNPALSSHLMIGGRDNGGNNFGNQYSGKLYDVRVYNYALSQSQLGAVVPGLTPSFTSQQVTTGPNGGQLVLSWSFGTLLEATNAAGPWNPTAYTSPFTNVMALPSDFFKVSNP
jgi:hypothetical protein